MAKECELCGSEESLVYFPCGAPLEDPPPATNPFAMGGASQIPASLRCEVEHVICEDCLPRITPKPNAPIPHQTEWNILCPWCNKPARSRHFSSRPSGRTKDEAEANWGLCALAFIAGLGYKCETCQQYIALRWARGEEPCGACAPLLVGAPARGTSLVVEPSEGARLCVFCCSSTGAHAFSLVCKPDKSHVLCSTCMTHASTTAQGTRCPECFPPAPLCDFCGASTGAYAFRPACTPGQSHVLCSECNANVPGNQCPVCAAAPAASSRVCEECARVLGRDNAAAASAFQRVAPVAACYHHPKHYLCEFHSHLGRAGCRYARRPLM